MHANVTCPACQHRYWIQEGDMGSRQICPNCQSPFFAGASVAEQRPAAAAQASPAAAVQAGYAKTMLVDSAPPIKYSCPRCKASLEAQASEAGTKKNCPQCMQRHQVPAQAKPEPAAATGLNKTMLAGDESAATPKPPIKYNCPSCKKWHEAPAEQAGTKRPCPACGQRLQIPAATPVPVNCNKTLLAGDESTAPANASLGAASADGARGAAAAKPAPAAGPWAALLTPRNLAIAIVVLLLLLVVPAVIRGGKQEDPEAAAKIKMELERLKAEIELKKMEMDRQGKAEARQKIDELMRKNREQEEQLQAERRRVGSIRDEDERAALERKLKQEQQQREKERQEMERKSQQMLEDAQRKLEEAKRAVDASKQQQQTIIQQPPPVIYYPPYHPRYYWPWW